MDIVLNNISVSFGGHKVLDNLSMSFADGRVSCLMGPSGCGKTTILNIIAGITEPDSGNVTGIDGRKMSYAFQTPHLLPWKTVLQNVEFVLPEELTPEARRSLAMQTLGTVELEQDASKYPSEISRGMAQRVSLARALAVNADIILLDEPFSGLDNALKNRIIARLKERWTLCRPTVIMVTHSEEESLLMVQRHGDITAIGIQ